MFKEITTIQTATLTKLKTLRANLQDQTGQGDMMSILAALAIGIVSFAIAVVIGSVVITNLGNAVGGTANTTAAYLLTQLGSSSGRLASWTPAIIAVAIGALFLSLFAGGFIGKKGY